MKKDDKLQSEQGTDAAPEVEIIPGEIPLYRTYGVTKKYHPRLTKINEILSKFIVLYLIVFQNEMPTMAIINTWNTMR